MAKILMLTRHTKNEFGHHRINLVLKQHGKRTSITYDPTRFSGTEDQQVVECVEYLSKKVEQGFILYVVLPKFLRKALLAHGISYWIMATPKKVEHGTHIKLDFYSPDKPFGDTKASKVLHRKKQSAGYVNTTGKTKARGNRR